MTFELISSPPSRFAKANARRELRRGLALPELIGGIKGWWCFLNHAPLCSSLLMYLSAYGGNYVVTELACGKLVELAKCTSGFKTKIILSSDKEVVLSRFFGIINLVHSQFLRLKVKPKIRRSKKYFTRI